MGKLDYRTGVYFSDENRFADFCNGVLYGGQQVIKPEELSDADSEYIFAKGKKNKKILVDLAKYWNGKYLRLIFIENQTYVDYRMVFRNMLAEAMAYERQWRRKKVTHDRNKDLQGDEYLSGISKKEMFIPVISIVVYYGENPWDGARCLYDLLDLGEDIVVRGLISNYQLNLFDYHDYKDFDMFQTELKNLFEVLRYAEQEMELKKRVEYDESYHNLCEETTELIQELVHINLINNKKENEVKNMDMRKAFVDCQNRGVRWGRIDGIMDLLMNIGSVSDELKNKIEETEDMETILRWFKLAMQVKSVQEFEDAM